MSSLFITFKMSETNKPITQEETDELQKPLTTHAWADRMLMRMLTGPEYLIIWLFMILYIFGRMCLTGEVGDVRHWISTIGIGVLIVAARYVASREKAYQKEE
jgi:hypothetical protein